MYCIHWTHLPPPRRRNVAHAVNGRRGNSHSARSEVTRSIWILASVYFVPSLRLMNKRYRDPHSPGPLLTSSRMHWVPDGTYSDLPACPVSTPFLPFSLFPRNNDPIPPPRVERGARFVLSYSAPVCVRLHT